MGDSIFLLKCAYFSLASIRSEHDSAVRDSNDDIESRKDWHYFVPKGSYQLGGLPYTHFLPRRSVLLQCRLPKQGFVPGEAIVAECTVDNGSSKLVHLVSREFCSEIFNLHDASSLRTFPHYISSPRTQCIQFLFIQDSFQNMQF